MPEDLQELINESKKIAMTEEQRERQRRSFVYGNIKIEEKLVTHSMVNEVADSRRGHQDGKPSAVLEPGASQNEKQGG